MHIDPLEFIQSPFRVGPDRVLTATVYQGGAPAVSGGVYGLDTETELITSRAFTPPLVVAQVSDGSVSELVPYERAAEYFSHMADAEFGVFNVGFDLSVLRDVWPGFMEALDQDRVVDVGLRSNLLDIATRGYTQKRETLQTLVSRRLRIEIEKDEDVRLTYTRDMTLTRKHIKYGAIDAAVTRWLMDSMAVQPTERLQTRAAFVLSEISRNGLLIDREGFEALRAKLQKELAEDAIKLRSFGFNPEATMAPKEHKEALDERVHCGVDNLKSFKDVQALLALILEAFEARDMEILSMEDPVPNQIVFDSIGRSLVRWRTGVDTDVEKALKRRRVRKDSIQTPVDRFAAFARGMELDDMAGSRCKMVPLMKAAQFLLDRYEAGDMLEDAAQALKNEYERTACWDEGRCVKPQAFLQNRLKMLEQSANLQLPRTETGMYETGRSLLSLLRVNGIKEPFFDVFCRYKHAEKLLSTYLKESDIGEDGRWHTRFTCILRTGRTSSSGPNIFGAN